MKTCEICRKEFQPQSGNPNRFCSTACRCLGHRVRLGTVDDKLNRLFIRSENGCLEWTGHRTTKGYGVLKIAGRHVYTHRLMWERTYGPIPAGVNCLHRCDNPPCGEIIHLFLGSKADNANDRDAKGRGRHYHKLTAEQVKEIRRLRAETGAQYAELGRLFNVTPENIEHLVKRRTWKHI